MLNYTDIANGKPQPNSDRCIFLLDASTSYHATCVTVENTQRPSTFNNDLIVTHRGGPGKMNHFTECRCSIFCNVLHTHLFVVLFYSKVSDIPTCNFLRTCFKR